MLYERHLSTEATPCVCRFQVGYGLSILGAVPLIMENFHDALLPVRNVAGQMCKSFGSMVTPHAGIPLALQFASIAHRFVSLTLKPDAALA